MYPTCCLTDWQPPEGGRCYTGVSHPHPRPTQFHGASTSDAKSTPPIQSPGENPSAASGRRLAASLLSVSWEPARVGRRWVVPEGPSAPHLLPVDSGSFPGTPLSSAWDLAPAKLPSLLLPGPPDSGAHTLPAPLCSPRQPHIPGPGNPQVPARSSPPASCSGSSARWPYLLLPGPRTMRFPK